VTAGTSGEHPQHRHIPDLNFASTKNRQNLQRCFAFARGTSFRLSNTPSRIIFHCQSSRFIPPDHRVVLPGDSRIFATLLPWRCMGSGAPHVYPAGSSLHNPFVFYKLLKESVNYVHTESKLCKMCKRGWSFGRGTDHAICDIDRENFTACSFSY
jgi:hypothetical protein